MCGLLSSFERLSEDDCTGPELEAMRTASVELVDSLRGSSRGVHAGGDLESGPSLRTSSGAAEATGLPGSDVTALVRRSAARQPLGHPPADAEALAARRLDSRRHASAENGYCVSSRVASRFVRATSQNPLHCSACRTCAGTCRDVNGRIVTGMRSLPVGTRASRIRVRTATRSFGGAST